MRDGTERNEASRIIRSRVFPGSVRKIERILVVFRKWLPVARKDFNRVLHSLRLSTDRRARDLASFVNYVERDFGIDRLREIYVETTARRKRYRWKHHNLVVHIRRKYRMVARLSGIPGIDT